jgi:hypothetical protein
VRQSYLGHYYNTLERSKHTMFACHFSVLAYTYPSFDHILLLMHQTLSAKSVLSSNAHLEFLYAFHLCLNTYSARGSEVEAVNSLGQSCGLPLWIVHLHLSPRYLPHLYRSPRLQPFLFYTQQRPTTHATRCEEAHKLSPPNAHTTSRRSKCYCMSPNTGSDDGGEVARLSLPTGQHSLSQLCPTPFFSSTARHKLYCSSRTALTSSCAPASSRAPSSNPH